jgi:hypothetical protein
VDGSEEGGEGGIEGGDGGFVGEVDAGGDAHALVRGEGEFGGVCGAVGGDVAGGAGGDEELDDGRAEGAGAAGDHDVEAGEVDAHEGSFLLLPQGGSRSESSLGHRGASTVGGPDNKVRIWIWRSLN